MLKLNLIPQSYFQRKLVKKLIGIFTGLFIFVLVALAGAVVFIGQQTAEANRKLQEVEPIAQEAERYTQEAAALRQEVQPIRDKIKYIEDVMKYNTAVIPVLQELSEYTYSKVTYGDFKIEGGQTLTVEGWAPSISDAGRYLLNMYQAKHLLSNVSISGPPGYRTTDSGGGQQGSEGLSLLEGAQMGYKFTLTGTLRQAIAAPAPPAGAAGGAVADPNATAAVPGGAPAAPGAAPAAPPASP